MHVIDGHPVAAARARQDIVFTTPGGTTPDGTAPNTTPEDAALSERTRQ